MPGVVDALVRQVGLTVAVLILIAYTVYENRVGAVARLQSRIKALAVATYRIGQEVDGVDETKIRAEVYENGGDPDVFPGDFDDEMEPNGGVVPDGGPDDRSGTDARDPSHPDESPDEGRNPGDT